ncbi:MAG: PKD domain-containing protein [Bacteroidota bacterium]
MKKAIGLISLLLLFFTSKTTQAGHFVGADLSYQCTTTPGVYKVTLKVYRDCNGIVFCSGCAQPLPTGTVTGCNTTNAGLSMTITGADASCTGVNFGSYTLDAQPGANGFDIIQTCTSVKTICTNCNSRTAGTFSPGIEVFTFEGNVNLNAIPASCCKVALGMSICCRNGAITNFVPGNFYTECIINRCMTPCNSAPTFTNDAIPLVCAGVDFVYNLGASDPDGDSLSYAFGPSLQAQGSNVTYNPPYSAGYPFAYLGAPNPNASYPAGLRIDPITGDILFRPSGAWVSNLVIEVTQWKKMGSTYVNVGTTRRDVQFQTQLCTNNLVPKIKIYKDGVLQIGQSFSTYANQQICLDIVAEDQQNLAATPTPILPDTTDLTWNNPGQYISAMNNATWTRNYIYNQRGITGPKADSIKFCWTPPISAIREQPHLFTVKGVDRFCPIPASATRGINIKVNIPKTVVFDSTNRKVFCANKTIPVSMNYTVGNVTLTTGNIFSAQLSDSSGNFNNFILVGTKTDTAKTGTINLNIPAGLSTTGNYKLRLKVSSDSNAVSLVFPISIVPGFSQPIVTNNTDSVCKGTNVLLSLLPTNSNYTFKWLLNNTIIPSANNDSLWLDTTGVIRAIVSNTGCSDTSVAKTITVYPKPIPSFTSTNFVCLPAAPISFTNTSSINSGTMSYNWKFSDGTNSTLTSPIKNIVDTGSLTVKLIATSNKNCMDSIQKTIAIRKTITPQFSINDSSQCVKNNAFVFSNQTNNQGATVNYTWNWGTGFIASNNITQNYSYPNAGNYTVKLVSNNNGCTDTLTKNVTVIANATNIGFTVNKTIQCFKNNNFVFTNTSNPDNTTLKYFWQFGNGDTSTQRSPVYNYKSNATFSVKLLITANNKCKDSATTNVTVYPSPTASFSINDSIQCFKNNRFNFTNLSTNALTYNWLFGDNTAINTSTSPTKIYSNVGNFNVKLIAANNTCFDTIIKPVIVLSNASSVSFLVNQASQCLNSNTFLFNNISTPNNNTLQYMWQFGNADTSTQRSPNYVYNTPNVYNVKLLVTANNKCIDSFSTNVAVIASPKASFVVNDSAQCLKNNQFVLNNTSLDATSFVWSLGDNTTSTSINTNKTYTNTGNYTIKLVAKTGICNDSITKTVSVLANAASVGFTINQATQCLKNNNFVFTNTSAPDNNTLKYVWQLGNGDTSSQRSPNYSYTTPNTYTVQLLVTANNKCVDTTTRTITVLTNPTIGTITGSNNANIVNPFAYSIPTQTNATYNWSIQNGTIQSGQNTNAISVMWTSKGTGKLGVLATNTNGCKDSAFLNVNINNVGIQDININQELSIYPNPTKSSIRINNSNNSLVGKNYIISNTIGQILLTGKLNVEETTVNLESLSAGIYLLSIEGISNQSIKVIKE